jgi:hypothetical protein
MKLGTILLPLFGLLTLPALAQIQVTVSNAPRSARRMIFDRPVAGIAVKMVKVCAPLTVARTAGVVAPIQVSAREIIQAAGTQGQFLFTPGAINLVTVRRSVAEITADVGEVAGMGGAFITGGVRMPPAEKTFAVTLSAGVSMLCKWVSGKLAPAPNQALARLQAQELPLIVTVPSGGCWVGSGLGRD